MAAGMGKGCAPKDRPLQEDLVSVNRLLTCNFPHGLGAVNPSNLGRALKKIGGEKLDRIVLADGTKPMIWAVRDIDEYVQMGPEKLRVAVAAALMRVDGESSPF